jgi:putative ABC transport system substrate-binding protein
MIEEPVMTRRRFGSLLGFVLLAWSSWAGAAEVAVLKSSDVLSWRPALDALKRAAASHNVTEYDLKGDRVEAERVLGTLKGKPVVLVALGPLAAQAAKELAPEMSLIHLMIQDPAKMGLVGGANITGVGFTVPVKNQLAAFRMVYPRGVKIGVIYSADNTGRLVQDALKASSVVRLNIVDKPVAADKEIPEAIRSLLKGDQAVDALWIPPDPILLGDETRRFILSETLKAGKPVYTSLSALVAEGALVSSGPDYVSIGEQAGDLVNRIAAGEKGGKIEMLIPRGELIINKKIAEKLKIEIPADALKAANKVF